MKRTDFERVIMTHTLKVISDHRNEGFGEVVLAQNEFPETFIKNVCTKVSSDLADEIDSVVALLGMTKRKFCEMAFIQALDAAKKIMREEGLYEVLSEEYPPSEVSA